MRFIILLFPVLFLGSCAMLPSKQRAVPVSNIERLRQGNKRFAEHKMRHPDQTIDRIRQTAGGQNPYAVVITCADSRLSPELIFDEGIGDLFVIRNAGNFVDEEDVLASIEYALLHLKVETVLLLGHEHCGAIEAATHGADKEHPEPEHISHLVERIREEPETQAVLLSGVTGDQLVHNCVVSNITHGLKVLEHQLTQLQKEHPSLKVELYGGIYHLHSGQVRFIESLLPKA
jgi:carbonic anhydrase